MLYTEHENTILSPEEFAHPGAEYRGIPFWSWNTSITGSLIMNQIDIFEKMGFGGFHIHPHVGMEVGYMSGEFLRLVKMAVEYGKQKGLSCWLYDECCTPSGTAGGEVTRQVCFRKRDLLFTGRELTDVCASREDFDSKVQEGGKPKGYYLASYHIVLEEGRLTGYERVDRMFRPEERKEGFLRHAYVILMEESPRFNGQTYVDAMNKEAVKEFIRFAYEPYFRELGAQFGKSIPAIYTDEPHIKGKCTLPFAQSSEDAWMTYTDGFGESFEENYGYDLLDALPELFYELPQGQTSKARWQYHDHTAELFAKSYCDTLGEWCEEHHIALTGHLRSECTLFQQTFAIGEAMRQYRSFQIPGIDILADQKEFSTVKQVVSAARQYGRPKVLAKLYGVTQWDADFKTYKLQGDWLAALGITVRMPHLAMMSVEGEGKRYWPASIFYQSPWYEKYPMIENHFARVNAALTRGRALCRVGVIHPIESFWASLGPNDQTLAVREQLEENFSSLMKWLLYGLVDFDLISEALLPEQCETGGAPLQVGCAEYDAVLVPDCRLLRSTTLERLEAFADAGGDLIFAGNVPKFVDAAVSGRADRLAKRARKVPFTREGILEALSSQRDIQVLMDNGKYSDNLFYQMRCNGGNRWLFLCHVDRRKNNASGVERYHLTVRGIWKVSLYHTGTGKTEDVKASYGENKTLLLLDLFAEDSALLFLESFEEEERPVTDCQKAGLQPVRVQPGPPSGNALVLDQPCGFRLTEPNVLVLDYAQCSLDDGPFSPRTEILRLDDQLRRTLGMPLREDMAARPWNLTDEMPEHKVRLRYEFHSDITVEGCWLAIEHPENAAILFNGIEVTQEDGWYVDRLIRRLELPAIERGRNLLEVSLPFSRRTNLEWLYILGNFGVELGQNRLIAFPSELGFGDITRQRLPFYTGNVIYESSFLAVKEGPVSIMVPYFANPVLEVFVDGRSRGLIACQPHRVNIRKLEEGVHHLSICAYGNRFNGFGTLHNSDEEFIWYGPEAYRTTGDQWTENYLVRPMGILSRVEICGEVEPYLEAPGVAEGEELLCRNTSVQKMLDYLRTHYHNDISLQDLADLCGINTGYAGQLIKNETGENFSRYLTQIRMDQAEKLLLTTDITVGEIARMVGYNDYFYFAKVFKKQTGMTPSAFRSRSTLEDIYKQLTD